jgi:SSS family solute:Na+ symporter
MAYKFGLAAWIFTLGSGIACLLLGLFFSKVLRESETITISELIGNYFGEKTKKTVSILSSIGMFIHIIAQIIAASAILVSIFNLPFNYCIFTVTIIFMIFVAFGGIKGASYLGSIKIYMLYSLFILSILIILRHTNLNDLFNKLPEGNWFSILSYGKYQALTDIAFMIIGVLSTQIYLQAIFSAKNVTEAKKGAFISAAIIPPIGLSGVLIGLYLRANHSGEIGLSSNALPYFVNHYFPNSIAGIFMGFLFVIISGTGSGLALGVTTNIFNDFFKLFNSKNIKFITMGILALSALIVLSNLDKMILEWSFLSMGLRGTTVFIPLVLITFLKDKEKIIKTKKFIFLPLIIYFTYVFLVF